MAFSRVRAAGWALFEILTSSQMNSLDIDHANAVDGAAGGTYASSTRIVVNGQGLEVGGTGAVFSALATFNAAADFNGSTTFDGASTFNALATSLAVRLIWAGSKWLVAARFNNGT